MNSDNLPFGVNNAVQKASHFLSVGRVEAARAALTPAITEYPFYARCRFLLLLIEHLEGNNGPSRYFKSCHDINDMSWQLSFADDVLARLIDKLSYLEPEKLEHLLRLCDELAAIHPENTQWRAVLTSLHGRILNGLGRYDEAARQFEQARKGLGGCSESSKRRRYNNDRHYLAALALSKSRASLVRWQVSWRIVGAAGAIVGSKTALTHIWHANAQLRLARPWWLFHRLQRRIWQEMVNPNGRRSRG